jgi:hypothetical protein
MYEIDIAILEQIKWHSDVSAYTRSQTDIDPDEHFKLFMVPGMTHCAVSDKRH